MTKTTAETMPATTPTAATLYTITAGGFTATADAFARDPATEGLWFLSLVGAQTALKAIWAALLKQPPDVAHLIRGAEGTALAGGLSALCHSRAHTVGTWTTKLTRLPVCGGWHALVYTTLAEYATEREQFLLLAPHAARGTRTASPLPGPAQSPAAAPLLGRLALAARPGPGRDHAAANRRPRRLRLPAPCRRPQSRPRPRRRRRHAHPPLEAGAGSCPPSSDDTTNKEKGDTPCV